jgi:membrane-associated phospholipid phosphatase
MRWPGSVAASVLADWQYKLWLTVTLGLLFCVPYFALQRLVVFPVRTLALSPLDRAIGFDPGWIWVYQSVYLLVGLVPWLATRAQLARYARGFAALSFTGFACFLLFPVAGPRPATVPTTGMYGWVAWYDRPTNAMPSLHVGLAAYTVLFGARMSRGRVDASTRRWLLVVGAAWAVAIAYAALATKQHYAIDLPAGLIATWLVHRWVR